MNSRCFPTFLLLFLSAGLSMTANAQKLTGIWRGYFISHTGEQYKLEFQIDEKTKKGINGVSYSYLDTRFYGKASMVGNFSAEKIFNIQELRTTEVMNLAGNGTCLMNYKLSYSKSGKEEFLEGSYLGKSEDRINPKNNGKWGDCGSGRVYLRRVESSEFYVEPFLRKNDVVRTGPKVSPPVVNSPKTNTKPPVANQRTGTSKTVTKPPVVKKEQPKSTTVNDVKKTGEIQRSDDIVKEAPKKVLPKSINIPIETRSRKNEIARTLTVSSNEILVKLYDNGEIDNDTISVYLDNQLIVANKKLTAAPITFTFKIDEELPEHTLVMVAENLGRIPPNTSLMIVYDGDKRYEVSITSTEQKNAMVRFRYQKNTD